MTPTLLIRIVASLGLCLGLALLYLRWRNPRQLGRLSVAAGGALLVAGLAGWMISGHGDVALSDGVVLLMTVALVAIAGHALTLKASAKPARERTPLDGDTLPLGRGHWSRFAARLLGSLVAAPAVGLMAGTLWRAYVPGDDADRLMATATIAMLVMAAAWVMQLASSRPWRACAALTAATFVIAGLVCIPMVIIR